MSLPTVHLLLRGPSAFDFDQLEQLHVLLQQGAGEAAEAVTEPEDQAGTLIGVGRAERGSIGIDTTGDCSPAGEL
jgi:hypothetical protein